MRDDLVQAIALRALPEHRGQPRAGLGVGAGRLVLVRGVAPAGAARRHERNQTEPHGPEVDRSLQRLAQVRAQDLLRTDRIERIVERAVAPKGTRDGPIRDPIPVRVVVRGRPPAQVAGGEVPGVQDGHVAELRDRGASAEPVAGRELLHVRPELVDARLDGHLLEVVAVQPLPLQVGLELLEVDEVALEELRLHRRVALVAVGQQHALLAALEQAVGADPEARVVALGLLHADEAAVLSVVERDAGEEVEPVGVAAAPRVEADVDQGTARAQVARVQVPARVALALLLLLPRRGLVAVLLRSVLPRFHRAFCGLGLLVFVLVRAEQPLEEAVEPAAHLAGRSADRETQQTPEARRVPEEHVGELRVEVLVGVDGQRRQRNVGQAVQTDAVVAERDLVAVGRVLRERVELQVARRDLDVPVLVGAGGEGRVVGAQRAVRRLTQPLRPDLHLLEVLTEQLSEDGDGGVRQPAVTGHQVEVDRVEPSDLHVLLEDLHGTLEVDLPYEPRDVAALQQVEELEDRSQAAAAHLLLLAALERGALLGAHVAKVVAVDPQHGPAGRHLGPETFRADHGELHAEDVGVALHQRREGLPVELPVDRHLFLVLPARSGGAAVPLGRLLGQAAQAALSRFQDDAQVRVEVHPLGLEAADGRRLDDRGAPGQAQHPGGAHPEQRFRVGAQVRAELEVDAARCVDPRELRSLARLATGTGFEHDALRVQAPRDVVLRAPLQPRVAEELERLFRGHERVAARLVEDLPGLVRAALGRGALRHVDDRALGVDPFRREVDRACAQLEREPLRRQDALERHDAVLRSDEVRVPVRIDAQAVTGSAEVHLAGTREADVALGEHGDLGLRGSLLGDELIDREVVAQDREVANALRPGSHERGVLGRRVAEGHVGLHVSVGGQPRLRTGDQGRVALAHQVIEPDDAQLVRAPQMEAREPAVLLSLRSVRQQRGLDAAARDQVERAFLGAVVEQGFAVRDVELVAVQAVSVERDSVGTELGELVRQTRDLRAHVAFGVHARAAGAHVTRLRGPEGRGEAGQAFLFRPDLEQTLAARFDALAARLVLLVAVVGVSLGAQRECIEVQVLDASCARDDQGVAGSIVLGPLVRREDRDLDVRAALDAQRLAAALDFQHVRAGHREGAAVGERPDQASSTARDAAHDALARLRGQPDLELGGFEQAVLDLDDDPAGSEERGGVPALGAVTHEVSVGPQRQVLALQRGLARDHVGEHRASLTQLDRSVAAHEERDQVPLARDAFGELLGTGRVDGRDDASARESREDRALELAHGVELEPLRVSAELTRSVLPASVPGHVDVARTDGAVLVEQLAVEQDVFAFHDRGVLRVEAQARSFPGFQLQLARPILGGAAADLDRTFPQALDAARFELALAVPFLLAPALERDPAVRAQLDEVDVFRLGGVVGSQQVEAIPAALGLQLGRVEDDRVVALERHVRRVARVEQCLGGGQLEADALEETLDRSAQVGELHAPGVLGAQAALAEALERRVVGLQRSLRGLHLGARVEQRDAHVAQPVAAFLADAVVALEPHRDALQTLGLVLLVERDLERTLPADAVDLRAVRLRDRGRGLFDLGDLVVLGEARFELPQDRDSDGQEEEERDRLLHASSSR